MSWKVNKPLQAVLLFIDLTLATVVLYEISLFWLGTGPVLSRPISSGRVDISSSPASSALELVMKKRRFTYTPTGRRDPFKSLLIDEKPAIPAPVKEIEQPAPTLIKPSVRLKGILWEEGEALAFLATGKQENQVVKVGDERPTAIQKIQ